MRYSFFAAAAASTLLLAACGGSYSSSGSSGGSSGSSGSASAGSATPVAAHDTVNLGKTGLGHILVDRTGRTIYRFEQDTGAKSTCTGACASGWPPVTVTGKPTAGAGVAASKLGTTRRADGSTQVTYAGHPLYTFAGDHRPGQTTGQDVKAFGASWYAVKASGQWVEDDSGSGSDDAGSGGSSGGSGGGYSRSGY